MLRLPGKKFFKKYMIFVLIFYVGIPLLIGLWFGLVAREGVTLANALRSTDRVAVYNYTEAGSTTLIASYKRPEPMYYFMLYTMATANKYGEALDSEHGYRFRWYRGDDQVADVRINGKSGMLTEVRASDEQRVIISMVFIPKPQLFMLDKILGAQKGAGAQK